MNIMERNNELRTAWEFVENTGRSIFLTGKAGTGKTTFLKTVVEKSRKRPIVVAPTGVAAINAGGTTIHSFFQLPLSPYVPGAKVESKFDFGREKRKIIASIDLLIIDDLGTENGNSYTVSQLFTCMEERQLRAKPIVITTNLNMEQIRARYSERIASRLFSNYRYIKLMGDDIRVRKLFLEGSPD